MDGVKLKQEVDHWLVWQKFIGYLLALHLKLTVWQQFCQYHNQTDVLTITGGRHCMAEISGLMTQLIVLQNSKFTKQTVTANPHLLEELKTKWYYTGLCKTYKYKLQQYTFTLSCNLVCLS